MSTQRSEKLASATDMTFPVKSQPKRAATTFPESTDRLALAHAGNLSDTDIAAIDSPLRSSTNTDSSGQVTPIQSRNVGTDERRQHQVFMMSAYLQSALEDKDSNNLTRYQSLLAQLTRDTTASDLEDIERLQLWIEVLHSQASSLKRSCADLVDAVLTIDWTVQSDVFAEVYISFLGSLVSAHAYYVVPVIRKLVAGIKWRARIPNSTTRETVYERSHRALEYILRVIPAGHTTLEKTLIQEFPHKREKVQAQVAYLRNALRVLGYAPALRNQILAVILEKVIQIDVEIQVELDEVEEEDDEVGVFDLELGDAHVNGPVNADDLFENATAEVDSEDEEGSDTAGEDSDSDSDEELEPQTTVAEIQDAITKLDSMLNLVFKYLAQYKSGDDERQKNLFYVLQDLFDRTILQTFKSRFTQFIIFYYCSFDTTYFPNEFLGYLMAKTLDTSQPNITRIAAASYTSSFVSRAKYLDDASIRDVINLLVGCCQQYLDLTESEVHYPDANKYGVFYALVQAVMYIFCFRWRVLAEPEMNDQGVSDGLDPGPTPARKWFTPLNGMQRILFSRLNPLKMCSPTVVRQFARVAHNTGFMYVYPVLEKNKRLFLPTAPSQRTSSRSTSSTSSLASSYQHQANLAAASEDWETFFPFDPYKLRSTRCFIDPIYCEWEGDDEEDDEEDEDEDEDEDDDDMNHGMEAMSISPSPARLGTEYLFQHL